MAVSIEVMVIVGLSSSFGFEPLAAEATRALPPMSKAVTAPVTVALRFMGNLSGGDTHHTVLSPPRFGRPAS